MGTEDHPQCQQAHEDTQIVFRTQEENLRSGLLLEQGTLCLLRTRPPRLRKFAFHMTLAGLRFNACDQKALGARAYRCAPTIRQSYIQQS